MKEKWLFLGDACPEKKKQVWNLKLDCERVCLGCQAKNALKPKTENHGKKSLYFVEEMNQRKSLKDV